MVLSMGQLGRALVLWERCRYMTVLFTTLASRYAQILLV